MVWLWVSVFTVLRRTEAQPRTSRSSYVCTPQGAKSQKLRYHSCLLFQILQLLEFSHCLFYMICSSFFAWEYNFVKQLVTQLQHRCYANFYLCPRRIDRLIAWQTSSQMKTPLRSLSIWNQLAKALLDPCLSDLICGHLIALPLSNFPFTLSSLILFELISSILSFLSLYIQNFLSLLTLILTTIWRQMDLAENYEEDLIGEIAMMKSLKHPNIVTYIDSFKHANKLWVRSLFFNC